MRRAKYRELLKQLSDGKKSKTPDDENKSLAAVIAEKKAKMDSQLKSHYDVLKTVAPGLVGRVSLTPDTAHTDRILLPSFFTASQRHSLGLDKLAKTERTLRVAQCYDTLEKLRKALGVRSFLSRHARKSNGYNNSTRAQASLKRSEHVTKQYAFAYRRSFKALEVLKATPEQLGSLQPLLESDLVMLSTWLEDEQYKSRGTALPWIWSVAQRGAPLPGEDIAAKISEWNEEGTCRSSLFP